MADTSSIREALGGQEVVRLMLVPLPARGDVPEQEAFAKTLSRLTGRRMVYLKPEALVDAFGPTQYAEELRWWPAGTLTVGDILSGKVNSRHEFGALEGSDSERIDLSKIRMVPVLIVTKDFFVIVPLPISEE